MLCGSDVAWPLMRFHSQRSWPVYGVSGFWTTRPREREPEDTSTEGQMEKAGHSGHRNKPPKKNLASWSNERRLAHCIILVQYHKPSATLDWDFDSSNIVFYWQLQIVINDVTRLNTQAQQFLCFKNPSCAHLKGTFVPVYWQTHTAVGFVCSGLYRHPQPWSLLIWCL